MVLSDAEKSRLPIQAGDSKQNVYEQRDTVALLRCKICVLQRTNCAKSFPRVVKSNPVG